MVVYIETGDYSAEFCSPGTEPRGTPYESVTLCIVAHFSNKKKTKFEAVQIIHTNM